MNKNLFVFFLVLLIVGISGCTNELITDQNLNESHNNTSMYKFEPFLNESYTENGFVETSTFYLTDNSTANVVNIIDNQTSLDITPMSDLTKTNVEVISDIAVIAEYTNNTMSSINLFEDISNHKRGSNLNYTLNDKTIRGQRHIYLNFSQPIRGYIAYKMLLPMGQNFFYIADSPSVIRVVLPPGYNTGNMFIGRARPNPDKIYYDNNNRMNLIWYNLVTEQNTFIKNLENITGTKIDQNEINIKFISIRYYKDAAPRNLLIAAIILSFAAIIIIIDYLIKRKKFRKVRNNIEKNIKKN